LRTKRILPNTAAGRTPAGAGKTHSLKALRAAAHRARNEVLVLAPTGRAVDEDDSDRAGHGRMP